MTAIDSTTSLGSRALALDPQAAIRPEPFGALVYHYGNRRLVFLKHPDLVRVVESIADSPTVAHALHACDIDPARHAAFERALTSLIDAEILHDRTG